MVSLEQHRHYLMLVARLLLPPALRSELDPEDLVQQTFEEVQRRHQHLEHLGETEVLAYLRRALRNNILDQVRRERLCLCVDLEASSARLEEILVADHSSPSERAARNEQLAQLARALADLPATQRQAVELKYLNGFSVADIGSVMGLTEAAVGGPLRRGVATLRQRLKASGQANHEPIFRRPPEST